jgi:mannose-6-phosphate isomerase-like protein (cupin superfamily)
MGMATVRRVVTGEVDGEAVFTKVEAVDPIPGTTIYGAWGWDVLPRLPLNPEGDYEHRSVFPPTTGVRVNVLEFPPGPADQTGPKPGDNRAWDDTLTAVPVHRERGSDTRFVATDTIDILFVISGEVVVELDGEREQTLRQGDVLVQNGTRHHWANRTNSPCLLGAVVFTTEQEA